MQFGRMQRALGRALFAIQHIGARNIVFARTHQRKFNLILNVFDMNGAAIGLASHQRADHGVGQFGDLFTLRS